MALQTSTIVMALVTCVPFGFAIHATVTGTQPVSPEDEEEEALRRYSEDASASEREMERLEREAQARLSVKRRELIGRRPASLGSAFPDLVLGTLNQDIPTSTVRTLRELQRKTEITIELPEGLLLTKIQISEQGYASERETDALCTELSGLIAGAGWGPGVHLELDAYESARQWHDAATQRRATLMHSEGSTCMLEIDQAVAPARWVAQDETSVLPLWAVGQPASKLTAAYGERLSHDEIDDGVVELSWTAPGVEHGTTGTTLTATSRKGKTIRVHAEVHTTTQTRAAVVDQLTALYGAPTISEDDDVLRWGKAKPPVALSSDEDDLLTVTVGVPE